MYNLKIFPALRAS